MTATENSVEQTPDQAVRQIAEVAYQADTAWAAQHGQQNEPLDKLDSVLRDGLLERVRVALMGVTPQEQHYAWSQHLQANGWSHADELDADQKTHPGLVDFDRLPGWEQAAYKLLGQVARGLAAAVGFGRVGLPQPSPKMIHPSQLRLLSHFSTDHTPDGLERISEALTEVAFYIAHSSRAHTEQSIVGLQKLLEAKDCFIRAEADYSDHTPRKPVS